MSTYDLVIKNGTVVDGSGLSPFRADVGISAGRIAAVGRTDGTSRRTIDAEGRVVTPGFIDGHTHLDAQVLWDHAGSFSCYHGVTTAVMGNCGFTIAPASKEQAPLVLRNLERAEDIPRDALAAGVDWSWTTFAEYLDTLDAVPKGINYVSNVGHSALRTYAMGERAFEEAATEDDLRAMTDELRSALRAGAWGFTTSRTEHHQTSDDRPVASRIASLDEVAHLVRAAGEEQAKMFQFAQDPAERRDREEWLVELAAVSRVPFILSASGRPGLAALDLMTKINARGGVAWGVTHPRGIGSLLSFRTQLPFDQAPEWRALRALPVAEQERRLRDPQVRADLVHAAHHGNHKDRPGGEPRRADFDRMYLIDTPVPPYPTVAKLAADRGVDPVELMIDVSLEHRFDVFFWQPFTELDDAVTEQLLRDRRTAMGFSDAGAHLGQMCDYSIYTHLLAYWVRQQGVFTIEEAVRMMTFKAARVWGLHDRGLIREGLVADLNVLDPAATAPRMPTLVHDLPAEAPRVQQLATGISATIVAGEPVTIDGVHTGAAPGRIIRRRAAA